MQKVAIIGSGFGRYGLLPAFATIPRCHVVALCGTGEAMQEAGKRYGVTKVYADWKQLLEHEDIDAVALAVTPDAQYEIAKAAIRKGLHVFAEKPLTATLAQARELLRLAKKKKITHCVDFLFPEIPAWKKVQDLLDTGKYGKLVHIGVFWDFHSYDIKHQKKGWKTDASRGGGALSFFFSHGLHYLERFAGTINDVRSSFTHSKQSLGGGEVGVDMLLAFKSGIRGTAHISCNTVGIHQHKLVLQCERALITLKNENSHVDDFTITIQDDKGTRNVRVGARGARQGEDERVKIVRNIAARFIESCSRRTQMHPSFEDGVRVQELIVQIRKHRT